MTRKITRSAQVRARAIRAGADCVEACVAGNVRGTLNNNTRAVSGGAGSKQTCVVREIVMPRNPDTGGVITRAADVQRSIAGEILRAYSSHADFVRTGAVQVHTGVARKLAGSGEVDAATVNACTSNVQHTRRQRRAALHIHAILGTGRTANIPATDIQQIAPEVYPGHTAATRCIPVNLQRPAIQIYARVTCGSDLAIVPTHRRRQIQIQPVRRRSDIPVERDAAVRRAREEREAREDSAAELLEEVAVAYASPEDFMASVLNESSVRG